MKIRFYETGEMNGSSYVNILSNAILNIEKNDEYCFLWSLLACFYPWENCHLSRVRNYLHYFIELNIEGFDFTNGF